MKLRSVFKASPSKFGRGVPLLWKGISLSILNGFLVKLFSLRGGNKQQKRTNIFLFESARSAIYNCLLSQGIGRGDEVIISSFTCDAVPYAVMRAGATVVYVDINDDLSMREEDVLAATGPSTKAVIVQNTFGKLGLNHVALEVLRSKDIFIIEDCALAIGSKVNEAELGSYGDMSVWSLEVSKTVTIGWGGVVSVNKTDCAGTLARRYAELGQVSTLSDIRRIFQLWFSLLMMKLKIPGSVFIWYFMYGTRFFRRSNNFSEQHPFKYEKIGKISSLLFSYMMPKLNGIFYATNRNCKYLQEVADKLGLEYPVSELEGEYVVSPRFSLRINQRYIDDIIRRGEKIGVEVGRWFTECPPRWRIEDAKIYSSSNAEMLSKQLINFPCHWTLTQDELLSVKGLMEYIVELK